MHSVETRKKISETLKGHEVSKATRVKLAKAAIKPVRKVCVICGKVFYGAVARKYCSAQCFNALYPDELWETPRI